MRDADIFNYRIKRRGRQGRPGVHRSAFAGSGFEIREYALMSQGEDPRRLDLHRSARDSMQRLWVQRLQQTNTSTVTVLADVSASIAVSGHIDKYQLLVQFIHSTLRSVAGKGDRFALHCADQEYRSSLSLKACRCRVLPHSLQTALRTYRPSGSSAEGLLEAAAQLQSGRNHGLVFLLSDFYWPAEFIETLCKALWHTHLVPVMLCDSQDIPFGEARLANFQDTESGRLSLSFRWPWAPVSGEGGVLAHRASVRESFAVHGVQVLAIEDRYDANLVSAYFYS